MRLLPIILVILCAGCTSSARTTIRDLGSTIDGKLDVALDQFYGVGREAVPALKRAMNSGSPEVACRAEDILRAHYTNERELIKSWIAEGDHSFAAFDFATAHRLFKHALWLMSELSLEEYRVSKLYRKAKDRILVAELGAEKHSQDLLAPPDHFKLALLCIENEEYERALYHQGRFDLQREFWSGCTVSFTRAMFEIATNVSKGRRALEAGRLGEALKEYEDAQFKIRAFPYDREEFTIMVPHVRDRLSRIRNALLDQKVERRVHDNW